MSRVRATGLALVNWKGVFFEHYTLDRHVTALEGANGAGKTTVMIAAYLVLLPDLSRLRFTNLGETGATGGDKGIWGRLGEAGRPSYAALDLVVADGQRLVMGVRVDRGAEPTLHLAPFVITGLASNVRLSELLLLPQEDEDLVAAWDEVVANVGRHGGEVVAFGTVKEYFAYLFDRGVTPLRLASDEERNKLNEMLRTSMTGGISRALTSELRAFLLREESGLPDTLTRMRGNLEACRRTRVDVIEARKLEHEISIVYDAGQSMFRAAVRATERLASETTAELRATVERQQALEIEIRHLDANAGEATERVSRLAERRALARAKLEESVELARRSRKATELRAEIAARQAELDVATERAQAASVERERASELRALRKVERDAARDGYQRAATGLSDTQAGLDELHRRVHEGRKLRRTLDEVRGLVGDTTLTAADAPAALASTRERRRALDEKRARDDRTLAVVDVRRREFEAARAILVELGIDVPREEAHARARAELVRFDQLERTGRRAAELEKERRRLVDLVAKRESARERATRLDLALDEGAAGVRRELAEAERSIVALDAQIRACREAALAAAERAMRARGRVDVERRAAVDVAKAREICQRLAPLVGRPPASRREASELQIRLAERRQVVRHALDAALVERDRTHEAKSALETSGGMVDPELLRIRDEVDGELMASRFEDLEVDEAIRREAELGELAEAICVEDADAAAMRIGGEARSRRSILFVDDRSNPWETRQRGVVRGNDLVVRETAGVRVSRLPDRPSLGRRARLQRAQALGEALAALDVTIEGHRDEVRRLDAAVRDAEALSLVSASLDLGDVDARAAEALAEVEDAERARREQELEAAALVELSATGRGRVAALSALLVDAQALDEPEPDLEAAVGACRAAVEAAAACERARPACERLRASIDALSVVPPSDEEIAALRAGGAALDEERARSFRLEELLETLAPAHDEAGYEAAEVALERQNDVLPALRAQHDAARSAVDRADEAVVAAESAWEAAAAAFSERDGARVAALAQIERLRADVDALGPAGLEGEDVSESTVDALRKILAELEREERELGADTALLQDRCGRRKRELEAVLAARDGLEERARPAQRAREAFTQRLAEVGLRHHDGAGDDGLSGTALWSEARSRLDLLLGRLISARGSEEITEHVRAAIDAAGALGSEEYLEIWLRVRDWLRRRVPSQVADVEEPLEALEQLRDQLASLEHRLSRQETDLRGASEDVARGIEVQLRRAKAQVRRLNQTLDGVAFGSIAGIRIKMTRVERMDQILKALREGAAQELLFQSNLPIEDALNEIFRRFGGGKTGGQRLLDYREYLDLAVEVQRRTSPDWELANPTRVSTGEAIGVGATLMMVVLTEWERDGSLLRSKRATGSLRFLFLDEANRLSQDNLGVLFELCKTLDLQLLIAAPEVAHAEGNTTYRLVRRLTDEGREEVIVSGRRAAGPAGAIEGASDGGGSEEASPRRLTALADEQLDLVITDVAH